ncbi:MAG: sugar phosphate nucleotidyltransferase [Chloroflexota bacterium]|nr:sugar phosphate nucleotidyltransferase [Chloroflexota bacterium]
MTTSTTARPHAVVLAGGMGTRLRPLTSSLPKPLVPIGNEGPVLGILLRQLAQRGFGRVTIAIGHLGAQIQEFVGDGSRWGLEVDYAAETKPLSTIGPVLQILEQLPEHFLVLNGDILTDLDHGAVLRDHVESGAPLTIATFHRRVEVDFGVLEVDGSEVIGFREKPTLDYAVSMGVYGLSRSTLAGYPRGEPFGFDELVLDLLRQGRPPRSHRFEGYWLDIGRPEDYERANDEIGTVASLLLPTG